jgi:two-component system nitrate/nitrite response regulator NarL
VSELAEQISERQQPFDIAIFEDHPLMREALSQSIVRHLPDASIIYKGHCPKDFLTQQERSGNETSPKSTQVLAILDLDLGDNSDPLENLNQLVAANILVIVVSALAKSSLVRMMLRNGAAAYVSKSADPETLRDAINATISNQQYMSPDIAVALLADDDVSVNLSAKEQEALSLYASGMKLDAVARAMDISRSTASEYIQRARKKYTKAGINLPTKTDLYRQAQKDGFLK